MSNEANQTLLGKNIIEPYGKGVIFLSNLHAHIHAGKAFKSRVANASVANNGHIYMQIIMPAGVSMHLKHLIVYSAGDSVNVKVTEDPTAVTDGTTGANTKNLNRYFPDDPRGIRIYSDPSAISGGEDIEDFPIGDIIGNADAIGAVGSQAEWIFKGGLKYIIDITNTSGTVQTMNILAIFYYL
jgi:hypothetical protein